MVLRRLAVVILVTVALSSCVDGSGTESASTTAIPVAESITSGPSVAPFGDIGPGWSQLPDPPLLPRSDASTAWNGTDVFVVGGWAFTCPPNADCAPPENPGFSDGAAYRVADNSWRTIADAPIPFWNASAAVIDGDVFVLTNCWATGCDPSVGLLRYHPGDDVWDAYPPPPDQGFFGLSATSSHIVAYSTSDENGEVSDWLFNTDRSEWFDLPDDPLPLSLDRHVVASDDDLMVFATPLDWNGNGARPVAGASYDEATNLWSGLPESTVSGLQAWTVDGNVIINPHFEDASGGVFEVSTNTWAPLPSQPRGATWDNDLAGVLGIRSAVFASPTGWIVDIAQGRWIEIQRLDDRIDFSDSVALTAVGRDLFLFGGEQWSDEGAGGLVNDAWVWRSPR
jgi:hypothetical protein